MDKIDDPSTVRSLDDVSEILKLAKLDENELLPASQALYFAPTNLHTNNYKFLELDKHLLECVEVGQSLYVVGDPDENAVICSNSKTYDVAHTETSNSLLLVENLKFNDTLKNVSDRDITKISVCGIFHNYLEVVLSKPHLTKLNQLLKKTTYKGPEHEYQINREDLLTHEELENRIQSSKDELKSALSLLHVANIDNKIRLLDFEYHFRVLSYMLKLIEENSWQLDKIDYEETMNSLGELVPTEVLNAVFNFYAEDSKIIDGLQLYRYKEIEVCRFFAQVLLYSAGKFNLNEFLQAWKESVPEGMNVTEDMLNGIAIIDRKSTPNVIWAFQEDTLPENVTDRFKVLFEAKDKWTVPEIAPYIQRLTTEKTDVNALLAKYARASTVQGIKYYSSKHGK